MKAAMLLLLVLVFASCASTDPFQSQTGLVSRYDETDDERPTRFMGGLHDAFLEHVGDSLAGLDFFWRSVSRASARDWGRMKATFR